MPMTSLEDIIRNRMRVHYNMAQHESPTQKKWVLRYNALSRTKKELLRMLVEAFDSIKE